jgi:uncharacterized membrane protein
MLSSKSKTNSESRPNKSAPCSWFVNIPTPSGSIWDQCLLPFLLPCGIRSGHLTYVSWFVEAFYLGTTVLVFNIASTFGPMDGPTQCRQKTHVFAPIAFFVYPQGGIQLMLFFGASSTKAFNIMLLDILPLLRLPFCFSMFSRFILDCSCCCCCWCCCVWSADGLLQGLGECRRLGVTSPRHTTGQTARGFEVEPS